MPMGEAPLTMLERLQYRAARWALSLPPAVQVRLSGKPPVVRDGLTLHPELQLMLSLRERLGAKELSVFSPEEARRRLKREALVHAGEELPVRAVREFNIDGPDRQWCITGQRCVIAGERKIVEPIVGKIGVKLVGEIVNRDDV